MDNLKATMILFEQQYDKLLCFAFRIVNDPFIAQDIVQQVCLNIIAVNPTLNDDQHSKNYFYRAIRNEAINALSIQNRCIPFSEEWLNSVSNKIEITNHDFEILDWFNRNIKDQPPELIEAFLRHALYKERIKDLALELEIDPAALRQQFHRLRKKLQKRYLIFAEIISIIRLFSVT